MQKLNNTKQNISRITENCSSSTYNDILFLYIVGPTQYFIPLAATIKLADKMLMFTKFNSNRLIYRFERRYIVRTMPCDKFIYSIIYYLYMYEFFLRNINICKYIYIYIT